MRLFIKYCFSKDNLWFLCYVNEIGIIEMWGKGGSCLNKWYLLFFLIMFFGNKFILILFWINWIILFILFVVINNWLFFKIIFLILFNGDDGLFNCLFWKEINLWFLICLIFWIFLYKVSVYYCKIMYIFD